MITVLVKLNVGAGKVVEELVELEACTNVDLAVAVNYRVVVNSTNFLLVVLHECIIDKEGLSLFKRALLVLLSILNCLVVLLLSLLSIVSVKLVVVLLVYVVSAAVDILLNVGAVNCKCIRLTSLSYYEDLDDRSEVLNSLCLKSIVKSVLVNLACALDTDNNLVEVCIEAALKLIVVGGGRAGGAGAGGVRIYVVALVEVILIGLIEVVNVILDKISGNVSNVNGYHGVDKVPNSGLYLLNNIRVIGLLKAMVGVLVVLTGDNLGYVLTAIVLVDLVTEGLLAILKSYKLGDSSLEKLVLCLGESILSLVNSLLLCVSGLGAACGNSIVVLLVKLVKCTILLVVGVALYSGLGVEDHGDLLKERLNGVVAKLVFLAKNLEGGNGKLGAVDVVKDILNSDLTGGRSIDSVYREYVVGKLLANKVNLVAVNVKAVGSSKLLFYGLLALSVGSGEILSSIGSVLDGESRNCLLNKPLDSEAGVGVNATLNNAGVSGRIGYSEGRASSNSSVLALALSLDECCESSVTNACSSIGIKKSVVKKVSCAKSKSLVSYLLGDGLVDDDGLCLILVHDVAVSILLGSLVLTGVGYVVGLACLNLNSSLLSSSILVLESGEGLLDLSLGGLCAVVRQLIFLLPELLVACLYLSIGLATVLCLPSLNKVSLKLSLCLGGVSVKVLAVLDHLENFLLDKVSEGIGLLVVVVVKSNNVVSLVARAGEGGHVHLRTEEHLLAKSSVVYKVKNVTASESCISAHSGVSVLFLGLCDHLVYNSVVNLCRSNLKSGCLICSEITVLDLDLCKSILESLVIETCVGDVFISKIVASAAAKCEKRHNNYKNQCNNSVFHVFHPFQKIFQSPRF